MNLIRFASTPRLTWQAALKKAKINLDLLTHNGKKKVLAEECVTLFIDMEKLVTNT